MSAGGGQISTYTRGSAFAYARLIVPILEYLSGLDLPWMEGLQRALQQETRHVHNGTGPGLAKLTGYILGGLD